MYKIDYDFFSEDSDLIIRFMESFLEEFANYNISYNIIYKNKETNLELKKIPQNENINNYFGILQFNSTNKNVNKYIKYILDKNILQINRLKEQFKYKEYKK